MPVEDEWSASLERPRASKVALALQLVAVLVMLLALGVLVYVVFMLDVDWLPEDPDPPRRAGLILGRLLIPGASLAVAVGAALVARRLGRPKQR